MVEYLFIYFIGQFNLYSHPTACLQQAYNLKATKTNKPQTHIKKYLIREENQPWGTQVHGAVFPVFTAPQLGPTFWSQSSGAFVESHSFWGEGAKPEVITTLNFESMRCGQYSASRLLIRNKDCSILLGKKISKKYLKKQYS